MNRLLIGILGGACLMPLLARGAPVELGLTTTESAPAQPVETQVDATSQPDATPATPAATTEAPAEPAAKKKPPILGIGPDVISPPATPRATVRRVIIEPRNRRR